MHTDDTILSVIFSGKLKLKKNILRVEKICDCPNALNIDNVAVKTKLLFHNVLNIHDFIAYIIFGIEP